MGEWKDYDWQGIAEALKSRKANIRVGDFSAIFNAFDSVRHLPFPSGYLEEARQDMIDALRSQSEDGEVTRVYLTFFGVERASHMKIGVARNVKSRLSSIRNGNPLPHLWTFAAAFQSRDKALRVEKALLKHMHHERAQGEWVNVHGLSQQASQAIADSLAEVATVSNFGRAVTFSLVEV